MRIHNPGWREELCISLICIGLALNMFVSSGHKLPALSWSFSLFSSNHNFLFNSFLPFYDYIWIKYIAFFYLPIVLTSILFFFLSAFFPLFIYDMFFFLFPIFPYSLFQYLFFRILVTRGWTVTCTVFCRPRPSFPCYPFNSCFYLPFTFYKHYVQS